MPPALDASVDVERRYPSRRKVRTALALIIDLVLHSTVTLMSGAYGLFAVVGVYVAVSLFHRLLFQRLTRTTLGKWVTGMELVRVDNGGSPTSWSLIVQWFRGVNVFLSTPGT